MEAEDHHEKLCYQYTYDAAANRLVAVSDGGTTLVQYQYTGLGDRISQEVDGVTTNNSLDIAGGLMQVLDYGEQTYLYGLGRITQHKTTGAEYFLADGFGLGGFRRWLCCH